jgi:hypothetical protein
VRRFATGKATAKRSEGLLAKNEQKSKSKSQARKTQRILAENKRVTQALARTTKETNNGHL